MDENKSRGCTLAEANRALQENLDRNQGRIFASYGLIGAILTFGGAGFVVDWWAGTQPLFLQVGLAAGIAIGFFWLLRSAGRR